METTMRILKAHDVKCFIDTEKNKLMAFEDCVDYSDLENPKDISKWVDVTNYSKKKIMNFLGY